MKDPSSTILLNGRKSEKGAPILKKDLIPEIGPAGELAEAFRIGHAVGHSIAETAPGDVDAIAVLVARHGLTRDRSDRKAVRLADAANGRTLTYPLLGVEWLPECEASLIGCQYYRPGGQRSGDFVMTSEERDWGKAFACGFFAERLPRVSDLQSAPPLSSVQAGALRGAMPILMDRWPLFDTIWTPEVGDATQALNVAAGTVLEPIAARVFSLASLVREVLAPLAVDEAHEDARLCIAAYLADLFCEGLRVSNRGDEREAWELNRFHCPIYNAMAQHAAEQQAEGLRDAA